ncbi:hypothetical protein NP233_g8931 [Leucocoprinus birnbaumii]|uniref:Alpha-1,2-mannosyltransferase n=1 Tax=Leucocoprinus birnbaumii TaxID=56174 RepID=A0AAD5VLB1_9AGAR|nr:hypothetical protein NP233_g8931 [Leucocoprinus birnbaumii]
MTLARYYLLLPLFLLCLYLFPFSRRAAVVNVPLVQRANATFYMLARNSDLDGVVATIEQVEKRFNRNFNYPYVLLNDVPFADKFVDTIRSLTHSEVEFGIIPADHWNPPGWINETEAAASRRKLADAGVKYAGSISYRNMCRFNSGFFFQHPTMLKYRWYWRLEPDVRYHCNIDFDPFRYMEEHNKTYAFTIATYEDPSTIPTLWPTVRGTFDTSFLACVLTCLFPEFGRIHPATIAQGNALRFISHNYVWNNFEIADMDFWRADTYKDFFSHLDQTGGFYYERWGDAPVHSIAAALFLNKNQIHFFDEIGYQHDDWSHCPSNPTPQMECDCDPANSFGVLT